MVSVCLVRPLHNPLLKRICRFASYSIILLRPSARQHGSLRAHLPFRGSPLCWSLSILVPKLILVQCVIHALQSRPPTSRSSLLPTTPSPHSSLPSSPKEGGHNLNNPFFASAGPTEWKLEPKLPIFFFARFALVGLAWVEQAVGRDRGAGRRSFATKERPGKRLM